MAVKKYSVAFSPVAEKKLEKLDVPVRKRIEAWIDKNLKDTETPRLHGHALTGKLSDHWRYRVGDWRLIAKILDDEIIILIINVDKRNDIYK